MTDWASRCVVPSMPEKTLKWCYLKFCMLLRWSLLVLNYPHSIDSVFLSNSVIKNRPIMASLSKRACCGQMTCLYMLKIVTSVWSAHGAYWAKLSHHILYASWHEQYRHVRLVKGTLSLFWPGVPCKYLLPGCTISWLMRLPWGNSDIQQYLHSKAYISVELQIIFSKDTLDQFSVWHFFAVI